MKRLLRRFAFSGLLLFVMHFYSEAQNKILILGSSTSGCFGLVNREDCYIDRLKKHFSGSSPVTIDNRAVAGWNVYKSMPKGYIPPPGRDTPVFWYTITDALAANPDLIIVNYPSNGYDVFTVAEVMFCFRTIKKAADVAGKRCFITTSQPRNNFSDQNRRKLREIKDSVLKQFGAFAIDFWTGLADPSTNMIAAPYQIPGDPVHMNAAAHEIMFQRVAAKLTMASAAVLPTFISFTGNLDKKRVILNWQTSPSQKISKFLVQHVTTSTFITIGVVPVNQANEYSFVHDSPVIGKNAYRITAVTADGTEEYSDTIKILRSANGLVSLQWFRSAHLLTLQADMQQHVTIRILNGLGQMLFNLPFEMKKGINNIPLNMQPAPGIYIIRVNGKDWTATSRFSFPDR